MTADPLWEMAARVKVLLGGYEHEDRGEILARVIALDVRNTDQPVRALGVFYERAQRILKSALCQ